MKMNILNFIAVTAVVIESVLGQALFEQTNVTTPNLVRAAGYPLETHQVTTQDGYILTMHRIPYSPKNDSGSGTTPKPVVYFQHGLLTCSSDWVAVGPNISLGYLLSDEGYDVWMANSRGNRYSMGHVDLDYHFPLYWNFSFHEMGVYDLPAAFDYISNATKVDQFQYIGHSQGTTDFFVYCATYSDCSKRIKAAHLLAPVVFVNNLEAPIAIALGPILGQPDQFSAVIGGFDFIPNTELLHLIASALCNDDSPFQEACAQALFSLLGPSDYFPKSKIPYLSGIYPAGASFKQYLHYLQEYISGKFRQYDNGALLNLDFYGSVTPPEYNLSRINIPIDMYYSLSDHLSTQPDVLRLVSVLPSGVVRNLYQMPVERWNHFDFLVGNGVKKYLYDEVLKDIRETE